MKRTKTIARTLLTALTVAIACGAYLPEAEACGGGWFAEPEVDYRVMGVAKAEESLKKGDYQAAAGAVVRMIPHIGQYDDVTGDAIINRAMRVLAVAMSRTDGRIDKKQLPSYMRDLQIGDHWNGKKAESGKANLAWSADALKSIAAARKKAGKDTDPVLESEMGEAMAKVDEYRAEGKAILERLAAKDLLTSPEAYKTLAELREKDGDQSGRMAALKRCKAMAKDAATCGEQVKVSMIGS